MGLSEVLQATLGKIQHLSKTETVFGDPITTGEVTLIPVSRVSIGFAAGGAETKNSNNGTGTGGGVTVVPVAFISITGTKVQIHTLEKNDPTLSKIINMAPEVWGKISTFMDRKKGKDGKNENE